MKNVTKANVLFASTVLVYIILVYGINLIPKDMLTINMLLVLPEVILLIPSLFYILFLRPKTVDDVRLSIVSVGTTIKTVLLTFAILPLVSLINSISSIFVGNSVDGTMNMVVEQNPLWLNLIIMALLPAVVEEVIFRGFLLSGYKKRNPLRAIILSSALFGLIHMNINQFSYAFVIGVIFGLIAYATGSLLPSVLAHFLINGTSITLSHLLAGGEQTEAVATAAPTVMDYVITFSFMGFIAIIGLCVAQALFKSICNANRGYDNVKRIFKKPYRNEYDEAEGKFIDRYLLLGIGVCLIQIILYDIIL